MKNLALALLITACLARVGVNDPECEVFTGKFGAAQSNGTGATKLAFNGEASFAAGTSNLSVKLRYSDDVYYNDPKYRGLTKEDGISNDLTCLDLKLLKFPDNTYTTGTAQEITDLTPTATSDDATRWRYLTYSIPGDQLKTRLVQTESTTSYVYTGYYAVAYYISTQVQFTFYFSFSVTVNKATNAAVDSAFLPISDTEALKCQSGQSCTITASSSVEFCTDSACTSTTTSPKIFLNNNFWLIQKITTAGLTQNYLSGTKVQYVGVGLNKAATIEDANYSVAGQAIYRMKATIAWDKVSIQVTSVMKTVAPSGRRLLATGVGENQSTQGKSSETCIMLENGTQCPSCSEMAASNANSDAPIECAASQMLLFIGIVLIGLLI